MQPPDSTDKPPFGWLEDGLFSGGDEKAAPGEVTPIDSTPIGRNRFRVAVLFAGQPPMLPKSFTWKGTVIVDCSGRRCLIDDFIAADDRRPLSRSFVGCNGRRWVGWR
jgi:hypothetical protein